jgi:hypothetical protein
MGVRVTVETASVGNGTMVFVAWTGGATGWTSVGAVLGAQLERTVKSNMLK